MESLRQGIIAGWVLCLVLVFSCFTRAQVRAWEGTIEIPTYLLGPPDPNPAFPLISAKPIYPYTMLDNLTNHRAPKTYRAIYLENKYLKLTVLPDLGGRLYSVYDKVDKREVFYRNNVVKYGLVALRGAWISGGIEFNFPNAHTVSTVSPVESILRQNPDGSATAVVGAMDWVTNMHWEIALTLRPDSARVEQQVTLFNSTPLTHPYWFWANAAVKATNDMQFIYPLREVLPDDPYDPVERWPVWQGVNESWYKNLRHATAIFGRQVHRNFFGAYYHNSDYGVVHVSNYREDPGKKLWSWGVAGDGLIWTHLLTDHDGPYNEIQSGRFETQVYREFIHPRQEEEWTEFWYPVRGLEGGFVEATPELALNVLPAGAEGSEHQVKLLVSPVAEIRDARVKAMLGSKPLREFGPVAFEPLKTSEFIVTTPSEAEAQKALSVRIESSDGKVLLRWSASEPVDGNPDFVPEAGIPPRQITYNSKTSLEALYLHGVWFEKRGDPKDAQKVFEQVLKRDPGFIPALLKEAWRSYRSADFNRAAADIARALQRDGTNPNVHYMAGVIYRAAGRDTLAQDAFWASIHFGASPAPSFSELGELAIRQKNYEQAASLLRRALSYNPGDMLARADLAAALRLGGNDREAAEVAGDALKRMPILPFALAERWMDENALGGAPSTSVARGWSRIGRIVGIDPQDFLAVAAWYHDLADFPSSDKVLRLAADEAAPGNVSPMIYYYLASNERKEGKAEQAREDEEKAATLACDEVFSNRVTDAQVLAEAIAQNPSDSHAKYALGNFLFAYGRAEDASKLWFEALGEGFEDPILMRNLGVYAWRVKADLPSAAGFYRQAIRLSPHDFRLYADLDEIYTQMNDAPARTRLFRSLPPEVAAHDTVRMRQALFLTTQRKFDEALSLLKDHDFNPWEGDDDAYNIFVRVNIEKGKRDLAENHPQAAARAFQEAMEFPENLGAGRPDHPDQEEQLYWLGVALEREGRHSEAQNVWREAAREGKGNEDASAVFSALAFEKLAENAEAQAILKRLIEEPSQPDAGMYNDYAAGIAELYSHHPKEAHRDFERALDLDPMFWPARIVMEETSHSQECSELQLLQRR